MYEEYDEERRLMPFLIAFLVTLLIIAGVLGGMFLLGSVPAAPAVQEEYDGPASVYLPRKEERLVTLLSLSENAETLPDVYLLIGFLPDKGRISVTLLPPATLITNRDQWGTINELYDRGGISYAAKAVGGFLDITIHRSGSMEVKELKRLMESVGFFQYDLPVALDYPLHQRQVAMNPGAQQLDGRALMDVLAYPAYKGGEQERSDRGTMLVTQLINHHLPACLTERGDSLAKNFLNCCKTDLSFKDYEERKSSARFLAQLSLPAAAAVYVEGNLSRDYSAFLLTESCRARLQSAYSGDGFALSPSSRDARLGTWETVEETKEGATK